MNIQRHPRSPYVKGVRPMVKADIEALRQPSARVRLQNIKDVHHIIARLTVSGLTNGEIALEVGYTETRISTIKKSPAMVELIARYRGQVDEAWRKAYDVDLADMLRRRRKAGRILEDYLDDHEENPVPFTSALKAWDSLADRSGYHRKSAQDTNINVNFAANLEEARARSRNIRLIDAAEE